MSMPAEEIAQQRSSQGSGRGGREKRPQTLQQQLSKIEKSVTHLLVATKQLLETLTQWSRGNATEGEVSDVYVRLGYEFNIASRAFNEIGVETSDLGNVPESLRGILEETLSQEASQISLDRYLPRIRDIIINLLHGLKKKQQRLRQRSGKDGIVNGRQGSIGSTGTMDPEHLPARSSSSRPATYRKGSGDMNTTDSADPPPRTTSVPGRASPNKYDSLPSNPRPNRSNPNRDTTTSTDTSMSSNTMQNMPVIPPFSAEEPVAEPTRAPPPYTDFPPPPPPPPPKQQDALAALQRGGDLERRASRRFSAYQLQKLVGSNGLPMIPPSQNSPVPNRGRETRESMNAVRVRGSVLGNRNKSTRREALETPSRGHDVSQQIKEEESPEQTRLTIPPPSESAPDDSPVAKTPDDKLGPSMDDFEKESAELGATLSGPIEMPVSVGGFPEKQPSLQRRSQLPARHGSRKTKSPSPPQSSQFISEGSPQPGKELTLFLQYKSRIKKYVLPDGGALSIPRLQLAFIEKFAWNTHNNGVDLPEIHIQDPVSGVRYELEDLNDIKDRAVLVLNVEVLDEVKRHIDDGLGGIRKLVEGIKATVEEQQASIQRVSARQVDAAKEIASIAAAPPLASGRGSMLSAPISPQANFGSTAFSIDAATQLNEVQTLRRDLAVVRQTYSSFVADMEASVATVRTKAANVKSTALKAAIPTLKGDTGRAYVNTGKKTLSDDSEKIVNRVDDLQDLVEDLRKDVVLRGVRPLPRQLETVAKDIQVATSEVKKLQDYLRKEKPVWTKIWEQELQVVCDERELLSMQEDLAADLEDDLEKAAETFQLVEQATKQQHLQGGGGGARSASGRTLNAIAMDQAVDPRKAKDNILGEVRALQPNHESRLEAIERAEKNRQRELEERRGGEFGRELAGFVDEGKLKKSGGFEEVERQRKQKDEQNLKAAFDMKAQRAAAAAERAASAAAAAVAANNEEQKSGPGTPEGEFVEAKEELPAGVVHIPGGIPGAASRLRSAEINDLIQAFEHIHMDGPAVSVADTPYRPTSPTAMRSPGLVPEPLRPAVTTPTPAASTCSSASSPSRTPQQKLVDWLPNFLGRPS